MTSLLRQIVASPRARHPEAKLDLCYVTDRIIATSGPSSTYPQRAYRNPLDALVKFLDSRHGENWAIWEFRAEGTGYPDDEVYGRIWHFPWPDHHPPPFALIPRIVASMRNWLVDDCPRNQERDLGEGEGGDMECLAKDKNALDRVVVVHCKAGKGRSGTASCSYLVSEEGWTLSDALARFTERRMRPGWGEGVSIPSQRRWLEYVERWTQHGKVYVERKVEVKEIHVWGMKDGVRVAIEGFVEDGKRIRTFHSFEREERTIVRGAIADQSFANAFANVVLEAMKLKDRNARSRSQSPVPSHRRRKGNTESEEPSSASETEWDPPNSRVTPKDLEQKQDTADVIFRPSEPVILPTSDINIDFERRNKATGSWAMVTSVAHVWFNAFFEGNGPEQKGVADDSGVFEIEWDAMDGIKGSSTKGIRAFDRLLVVWKTAGKVEGKVEQDGTGKEQIAERSVGKPEEMEAAGIIILEPKEREAVRGSSPADWRGVDERGRPRRLEPEFGRSLGLRKVEAESAAESEAGSVRIQDRVAVINIPAIGKNGDGNESEEEMEGVRATGPDGLDLPEENERDEQGAAAVGDAKGECSNRGEGVIERQNKKE